LFLLWTATVEERGTPLLSTLYGSLRFGRRSAMNNLDALKQSVNGLWTLPPPLGAEKPDKEEE
jgi:hypothetical protein